ncbi:MAG: cellulose-binding protein [Proteobacteria bacterium]|nr:cellulose-binding protein [Pseudomonadota bacterium]
MKTHRFNFIPKLALATVLLQGHAVFADTLPAPVPNVIINAASSWGTATDSWAGYTGDLAVWVPTEVTGGWVLTFQSAALGKQAPASSFWNANASFDPASNTYTLTSPSWGGNVSANSVLDIGFNGAGVLSSSVGLSNCKFNGQPCAISVMSAQSAQQTLANLKASYQPGQPPTPPGGNTGAPVAGQPPLQVEFSVGSTWVGGYSGIVAVKNLSSNPLPAGAGGWQARLKFPDANTAKDVFKDGPWNFQVKIATDGTATLSPATWAVAMAPGDVTLSGFGGGSVANVQKAASADQSVTVVFAASVPNSPAPNPTPNPNPNPNPVPNPPLPTGNNAGLLFSPYKDVTVNMNWNTNVMSTAVLGTPSPLLDVLPTKVRAVTWAFATGECGAENWAGINPDDLVKANLQKFVNANINYVISTGGAAGAFTCSTVAGMRNFINRYASANLVGIDFDIEAGQSHAAIVNLVKQAAAVQADYPTLRFSFTLATLGSSNGTANTNPYGDLNVTGYNVIQAINQQGLSNYTINLMVMDFGSASPANCVVVNGVCDMGNTAIQAAKNLNSKYGIPFTRIELTPMIGLNDVTSETFSLLDVDTLSQWALSNGLVGVHFWSVDRDKPCSQTSASPVCSSLTYVPAWGFTNRFATDLGF